MILENLQEFKCPYSADQGILHLVIEYTSSSKTKIKIFRLDKETLLRKTIDDLTIREYYWVANRIEEVRKFFISCCVDDK